MPQPALCGRRGERADQPESGGRDLHVDVGGIAERLLPRGDTGHILARDRESRARDVELRKAAALVHRDLGFNHPRGVLERYREPSRVQGPGRRLIGGGVMVRTVSLISACGATYTASSPPGVIEERRAASAS